MIEIKKYAGLSDPVKEQLNFFIEEEFGHIPIVNETEWATPDWTIIYYHDDQIATFYNIIEREIIADNHRFKAGGINNVITPKAFRGQGYSSKLLRDTRNLLFDDLNCALGLLLCADALIPFYERLGWYTVDCPVHYDQSTGKKLWQANTMLLSPKELIIPDSIDLNGLPW